MGGRGRSHVSSGSIYTTPREYVTGSSARIGRIADAAREGRFVLSRAQSKRAPGIHTQTDAARLIPQKG